MARNPATILEHRTSGANRTSAATARPRTYYRTPLEPEWVRTPTGKVLAIDGRGAPGGKEFQAKLHALYGVGYTLKFDSKAQGRDFRLPPLEGLWWLRGDGRGVPRGQLHWRLQIPIPRGVSSARVDRAKRELEARRAEPWACQVALRSVPASLSVQLLHVGPYSEETGDLGRMKEFAVDRGRSVENWHEEIYLSDPRRTSPEKLRTILRRRVRTQPRKGGRTRAAVAKA